MSNTQKTLHSFFNKNGKDIETNCPGCGGKFPSSKIKWHKDFECKTVTQQKRLNKTSHSNYKVKKIKKKVEQLNSQEIEVICIDVNPSDINDSLETFPGITYNRAPSPVLWDLEEEECLLENNDLFTNKENLIDTLKKDWDTPQSTPVKEEIPHTLTDSCSNSPFKLQINKKLEKQLSDSSVNSDFSLISNSCSEDEFEQYSIVFRSPTPKRLKKKVKSTKKNVTRSETDFEEKHFSQNIKKEVFDEIPKNVSEFFLNQPEVDPMYSDMSDNNCNGHSSMLVSPTRTPTPSPESSSKSVAKVITLSNHILKSPDHFNLKKTLLNLEDSTEGDICIKVASPTASSHKKTPQSIIKLSQKTTFEGSCISSSHRKVCRKLNASFDEHCSSSSQNSFTLSRNSPNKYRNYKGLYLENFLHILDTVISQPEDLKLLNTDDLKVIKGFNDLTLQAQKLYVRLFQRKIRWNRVSKLNYAEICDQDDISLHVNELVYADYIISEKSLTSLKELLQLLDASEVKKLCKDMKLPTAGNKDCLVNKLVKCESQQKSFMISFNKKEIQESQIMKIAKQIAGKSCILNKDVCNMFMRILLLYSPPRFDEDEELGQQTQLTTLLLVAIGRMKFPNYKVKRCHSLYQSRDDVLRFQTCLYLECEIQDCFKNQAWDDALKLCKKADDMYLELQNDEEVIKHDHSLPPFLRRFTTLSLVWHIQFLAVEAYQRLKQYSKAVKQLEKLLNQKTHLQDSRGRWYDRLALNLHQHLKKPKRSLEVIKEALEDPEVRVGHRLALSQRAKRLLPSKGSEKVAQCIPDQLCLMTFQEAPKVFIQGKSLPSDTPGYKRVFISSEDNGDDKICSVEELVLDYYQKEGYPKGLHCEARTVRGLFGLFFWKALYFPIPDAFRSSYQGAPLDLDSPHFYSARKEMIDKRLRKMEQWSLEEANLVIKKVWTKNEGCISIIDWKIFSSLEFTQGLVAGLGLKLIAAICRRFAEDHRFTRSGFPDLIVWSPVEKKSRIVEVKGPNDVLSTKQMLWLDYLLQHGAVAEVCHVEAVGAKRTGTLKSRRVSPKKKESSKVSDDTHHEVETRSTTRSKRKRNAE